MNRGFEEDLFPSAPLFFNSTGTFLYNMIISNLSNCFLLSIQFNRDHHHKYLSPLLVYLLQYIVYRNPLLSTVVGNVPSR